MLVTYHLNASFLSLTRSHPIWASLDSNPYQAKDASVQALFLFGQCRTEKLCRFWSQIKDGNCLLYPLQLQIQQHLQKSSIAIEH